MCSKSSIYLSLSPLLCLKWRYACNRPSALWNEPLFTSMLKLVYLLWVVCDWMMKRFPSTFLLFIIYYLYLYLYYWWIELWYRYESYFHLQKYDLNICTMTGACKLLSNNGVNVCFRFLRFLLPIMILITISNMWIMDGIPGQFHIH